MTTYSQGISLDQFGDGHVRTQDRFSTAPAGSQQKLLDVLAGLNKIVPPVPSLDSLLSDFVSLTREAMSLNLCVVSLVDTASQMLTLRAASPDLSGHNVLIEPVTLEPALETKLQAFAAAGRLPALSDKELAQLNPLKNIHYNTLLVLPLLGPSGCFGLLNCYTNDQRDYTEGDHVVLTMFTTHVSLVIQNCWLQAASSQADPLKLFFDDLLSNHPLKEESLSGRAIALGCDPSQMHAMVMIEVGQVHENTQRESCPSRQDGLATYKTVVSAIKERVQKLRPRSLLHERENMLYGILALEKNDTAADLTSWLANLVCQLREELHVRLFAGVGTFCQHISQYRDGFAGACEALEIGRYLHPSSGCQHFQDLGAYRYIFPFVREQPALVDMYQEKIAVLAHYDETHKRADLLETLETCLSLQGNIKEAAECLHVHRNTLLKRLERIQELSAIKSGSHDDALALYNAILVYKASRACTHTP